VKYFTPELLAKCRSSNPDTAEKAAVQWQRQAENYRERLQDIQDRLPPGVRQLLKYTTLHDAHLLTINLAEDRGRVQLFLSFQLAGGDRRAGVLLRYDGFEGLEVLFHERKVPDDTALFALYDEFDVSADDRLTHSLLLTAGVEIRVRFRKLLLTRLTRVVAPGRGRSGIKDQLTEMATS
jgi:hypothetical protein